MCIPRARRNLCLCALEWLWRAEPECCVLCAVCGMARFGLDLSAYPTLLRVEANLEKLPAFQVPHCLLPPRNTPS